MAISNLTTPELLMESAKAGLETLQYLESALREVTGVDNLVDATISRLELYQKLLKAEEDKILALFGVSDEAALKALFRNFYINAGLTSFSGPQLENNFLEAYRIKVQENARQNQEFINKVLGPKTIEEMYRIAETEGVKVTKDIAVKAFNTVLKGMYVECNLNTGRTTVTSSGKAISDTDLENEGIKILATKLTTVQKKRVQELRQYAEKHGGFKVFGDTTVKGNIAIVEIKSEWYDLTKGGLSWSKIQKDLASGTITQQQLTDINNQLTDLIVGHLNGKYQDIARTYIQKMLRQTKGGMFFVGENVNGITGILNEIGAVMAIGELLPNTNVQKIVHWVAQNKNNVRDLSIDVILHGVAGIQVKGSAQGDIDLPDINIDFAKGTAETILGRMQSAYPGFAFEDLEEVFESEAFNVPAKPEGKTWQEVGLGTSYRNGAPARWGLFVEAYNLMQQVISSVHHFLSAFAPDFLYMSGGQTFISQLANLDLALDNSQIYSGNTLYLVNGMPFFASSMLEEIIKDISDLKYLQNEAAHFSIRSSLGMIGEGDNKVPYDYVAYRGNKTGGLSRKVKLTSSYTFSNK